MSGVKDKHVEVDGKVIGGESLIRLNVKTAMWIIGGIFSVVMTILTWSYFDLKSDVAASQEAAVQARKEFIEKVDGKLDKLGEGVHDIELSVSGMKPVVDQIKEDIDQIIVKQIRDNPVVANPNRSVTPTTPPPGE